MSDDSRLQTITEEILQSPKSRRHFLTGAAAAAAGIGLAPALASAAAIDQRVLRANMAETTTEILNIAATAEAAAVTALYNLHVAVNQGRVNTAGVAIPVPFLIKIVRGILRQEQDHFAFLTGAGAKPLLTSFSFPPAILQNAIQSLKFLELADTIFTGAYMAANREFAQAGMPKLAQYSYQIGATEAAHRSLARAAQGLLPNNRSFERNLFKKVGGAAHLLGQLGVLKPGLNYPGAAAVDHILRTSADRDVTAHVIGRHP